jgi:hypothetical protein
MISRNLARRLSQPEARLSPAGEPMTIRLVFVDGPNKEVTGSLEIQVGDMHHSGAPGKHVNPVGARTGDGTAVDGQSSRMIAGDSR